MEIVQYITTHSGTFLFVLIRTGAILFTAPIFGAVNIPMTVKAGLSFVIALVLAPLTAYVPVPASLPALVVGVA